VLSSMRRFRSGPYPCHVLGENASSSVRTLQPLITVSVEDFTSMPSQFGQRKSELTVNCSVGSVCVWWVCAYVCAVVLCPARGSAPPPRDPCYVARRCTELVSPFREHHTGGQHLGTLPMTTAAGLPGPHRSMCNEGRVQREGLTVVSHACT
jgi:hypothetical protein